LVISVFGTGRVRLVCCFSFRLTEMVSNTLC
jgi:hypothetical protein